MREVSNIEEKITQIAVKIRIAEKRKGKLFRRSSFLALNALAGLLGFGSSKSKADQFENIEAILTSLSRLKALVSSLQSEYFHRRSSDDEIFKPSNVNIEFLLSRIDTAINTIEFDRDFDASQKEQLLEYMRGVRVELVEESPAWKKIVGALIICSTLLSGISVAPDAMDNINRALKHILGSSVEKNIPNFLPKSLELNGETDDDSPKMVIEDDYSEKNSDVS